MFVKKIIDKYNINTDMDKDKYGETVFMDQNVYVYLLHCFKAARPITKEKKQN